MISDYIISKVASTLRFSGTHLLQNESIADHSVEMALLCINFSELAPELDVKDMVYRCIIHDLEETLTTDIPRPIKYFNPKIKELIDEAGKGMLAQETDDNFAESATSAKDPHNVNGLLVRVSDRIQCLLKMKREVEVYGNRALKHDLESFKSSIYEVLNLINDSDDLSQQSKSNLISYLNKIIIN